MFTNLSTGTKLFILCGVFFVAIAVPIYNLIIDKQAAIDFTRKELLGSHFLAALRGTDAAILTGESGSTESSGLSKASLDEILRSLATAQADGDSVLHTADLEQNLATLLREAWLARDRRTLMDTFVTDALAASQELASRVAGDSNLALDPYPDSYYVQDIVVEKMPKIMGQLGEAEMLLRQAAAAGALSAERGVRLTMLNGLLVAAVADVKRDLAAAYRADADGKLKRALDPDIAEMARSTGLYLNAMSASLPDAKGSNIDMERVAELYKGAVQSGLQAWTAAHAELDRLLSGRIAELIAKMRRNLSLTGALALLSVLVAIIAHRNIVPPLQGLASLAREVSETKNYDLRVKAAGKDEIGRLAATFNEMLSELAAASHRESAAQMELARVARLTAAGAMTASIAHEINQPLAAIVSNGSAGLRWLRRVPPDLSELEEALQQIVSDGNRAGEVIGGIRSMFKADGQASAPIDVNDLIRQTLTLVQGELRSKRITLKSELLDRLPQVSGSRAQLQQVILNLIMNAAEAMASVADRARVLRVRSHPGSAHDVVVTVEDSGAGIGPEHLSRIFDAFFTTKSEGMGMGLSICRTIINSHGGRIWASPGDPHGSIFSVALPAADSDSG